MGYSELKIINDPLDGMQLIAAGESNKGGIGISKTYNYAREFIGDAKYKNGIRYVHVPINMLHDGDLLEIQAGGSWKNAYRNFYEFKDGNIHEITESELRTKLAIKLEYINKKELDK